MAICRLKISDNIISWAIHRAGINKNAYLDSHPKVRDWMSGDVHPTIKQIENFAHEMHVPLGFLLLEKPPIEKMQIPLFRGHKRQDAFDVNLYDTINTLENRQNWLADYLAENKFDKCSFINSIKIKNGVQSLVDRIHYLLDLPTDWAFSERDSAHAVNRIVDKMEELGIIVIFNGVVGYNTHRPINVDECRGFALVNDFAPFIYVNSSDAKTAQLFTLVHEMAHLLLGFSSGFGGDETNSMLENREENFCNSVAAEFLVPSSLLKANWNNISRQAKKFKVSEIVIARCAHDLGLISDSEYQDFFVAYVARPKNKKANGKGDFYATAVRRVGRVFAYHVRNAVGENKLSYLDAFRLTGLYGNTYDEFMTKYL